MTLEELTEAERRMRPDFVATVPRGKPMTREQAGGLSSNPRFYDKDSYERGYQNNCQSCVVSYAIRLRGYDVEARRWNYNNNAQKQLATNTAVAWIDPISRRHPEHTTVPAEDSPLGLKWLNDNLENNGVYSFEFIWRRGGSRHVVVLEKVEEKILEMLKPGVGVMRYPVKKVSFLTTWKGYDVYRFCLDVDDDEFIQVGTPWFFLVKGDEITKSDFDQTLDIIEKVYDETHGPDDEDDRRNQSKGKDRGPAHPPGSPMFLTEASSLPRARCPEPSACR